MFFGVVRRLGGDGEVLVGGAEKEVENEDYGDGERDDIPKFVGGLKGTYYDIIKHIYAGYIRQLAIDDYAGRFLNPQPQ